MNSENYKKFSIAQAKSLDVFSFKSLYPTSAVKSLFVQNKVSV